MPRKIKQKRAWITNQYDDLEPFFYDAEDYYKEIDTISVKNDEGDTIYLKEHEINDVLETLLDKVIKAKGIDLTNNFILELRQHIDDRANIIRKETMTYFADKIDKLAEKIAMSMIDSDIEKRVKEKVEIKLEQMRKLL